MERPDVGVALLAIARCAIARELDLAHRAHVAHADLMRVGASFVTLRRHGDLRGCIGTLDAWRALADDVHANACAAAFRDPRFAPVCARELAEVTIEVSVLNPSERMQERAVRELVEQRGHRAQEWNDGQQLEHQRAAPGADPRCMVGAGVSGLGADVQAGHDGRRAGQR